MVHADAGEHLEGPIIFLNWEVDHQLSLYLAKYTPE
jgi:hypothetical protein